ncbi:MAG: shikimate dehydrogenase [Armatimonadota bacterium]|nr:shikimate dehydrogenase [Armatimonadota bacterium]
MYQAAQKPTMYFIGVTTSRSSIMRVFPEWARYLGLGDCAISGMDFVPHSPAEAYREAVSFIKSDERSLGALVTTHKVDLLKACADIFEELDPYASLLGELSSISKRDGKLVGHAKDPITSGLALEAFLPERHWEHTGAEVFIMGAGGSSMALTWHLMKPEHGANRPPLIVVANRSAPRLEEMQRLHQKLGTDVPVQYIHAPRPEQNDEILAGLKPHSLVVNATGLGKDAPGSPLTSAAVFPERGFAWDFNYRGDLVFLEQAQAQRHERHLHIEDGWVYFVHGWTQVIAEVFHIDIPPRGPRFEELSRIAAAARRTRMEGEHA